MSHPPPDSAIQHGEPSYAAASGSEPLSWRSGRLSTSNGSSDTQSLEGGVLRNERANIMANWLHSKQEEYIWTTGSPGEGVVLKVAKGQYVCAPTELRNDSSPFFDMVALLNIRVSRPPDLSRKTRS